MTLRNSFRLGRILGIEVALHYSWFIIFALVFWALGSQVFPSWYPDMTSPIYYGMAAATTVLFFGSVLAHEIMHSVVAKRRGGNQMIPPWRWRWPSRAPLPACSWEGCS